MPAPDTTLVRRLHAAVTAAEPYLPGRLRGWALFVPLLCEGRCRGILVVAGRSGSGTVRPHVRRIAESVAATASLVILLGASLTRMLLERVNQTRRVPQDERLARLKLEVARRSEAAAHHVRHSRP